MSTSKKKVAANRLNGKKSQGPKNTSSTRFNATKHGLLAVGITELDDSEGYRITLCNLTKEKNPVGSIEMFLIESAALEIVRLRRARRLEAEYITSALHPTIREAALPALLGLDHDVIVDPGLPAVMSFESVEPLVSTFQRYESTFAARLFRTLRELERLQRMRQGERLPAPSTLDVNVQVDTRMADSVPDELGQLKALAGDDNV